MNLPIETNPKKFKNFHVVSVSLVLLFNKKFVVNVHVCVNCYKPIVQTSV